MRQHFVPQVYLRGFLDSAVEPRMEPYLWVAELDGQRRVRRRAPKNLGWRTDYYDLDSDSPGEPTIDDALQLTEVSAAPVLRALRDGSMSALTEQARANLLYFFAFLATRVPASREMIDTILMDMLTHEFEGIAANAAEFKRNFLEMREAKGEPRPSDSEIEDTRARLLDRSSYEIRIEPRISLCGGFLNAHQIIYPIFNDMAWCIMRTQGDLLVTSDCPVVWIDPAAPDGPNDGLLSPTIEVTIPISPSVLLLGTWHGMTGTRDMPVALAQQMNIRQLRAAHSFLVASSQELADKWLRIANANPHHGRKMRFNGQPKRRSG